MTRAQYRKFIDDLRLPNISGQEIVSLLDNVRDVVRNSVPPRELWPDIVPALWSVQHLRTYLNLPVEILSTYRSPEYNRAVGGASQSYHKRNAAVDFRVIGLSSGSVHHRLVEIRAAGAFRGGLGLYRTFVHIDHRGRNADFGDG